MLNRSILRRTAAAVALALTLPAIAAALKTDPSRSAVSAVFKQMNVPVEGKFKKFNAQIDFDSARPEASKASMEIDIGSFDLGDPEFNKEAQKKEWFNGAQYAKASFVSSALKPGAGGKLDVAGKLTIKGKTADVSFPLTVKKEGANQVFEGALPIKRLTFNIGEGEWKDTSMVADEVVIKFRVVTAQ
ncbi:YceI family protein [Noviherbaspirillum cavernae]|uniref:YceI family protein n=1 Tax=Noviherbaspirillum cavernae TaxID=2320862 RepID=A0A418X3S1_9BURK|nr:YceI family protein [Noviherbaspirillum cavernae]RJG07110.1 YceI family protein [Noviherbaspirillum cavernae]